MQRYLDIAATMRPMLDQSGGCLFIDRFRSLERDGWLLSYQIWRDEASMVRWRLHAGHHRAQNLGREEVFSDYRLRVARVLREDMPGRPALRPRRLSTGNDPARRAPRLMIVADSSAPLADIGQAEVARFESLYRPGRFAQIATLASPPEPFDEAPSSPLEPAMDCLRICEIERDYGMHDRAEAPQSMCPVSRPAF